MPKKEDDINQRILDMLEQKRQRRQGLGEVPLAEQILKKNGSKPPKLPRLPRL